MSQILFISLLALTFWGCEGRRPKAVEQPPGQGNVLPGGDNGNGGSIGGNIGGDNGNGGSIGGNIGGDNGNGGNTGGNDANVQIGIRINDILQPQGGGTGGNTVPNTNQDINWDGKSFQGNSEWNIVPVN